MKRITKSVITAATISALAATARASLGFSVYTYYDYSTPSLDQGFCEILDEKYKANLTGLRPDWSPIPAAKNLQFFGGGLDLRIYKDISGTWRISYSTTSSKYDKSYVFRDAIVGDYCDHLIREENNEILKNSVGLRIKLHADEDFRTFLSFFADYYRLNGDSKLTRIKGPPNNPSSYTQWRNASYKGDLWAGSAELGLEWLMSKHFTLAVLLGDRFAFPGGKKDLEAKGKETVTSTSSRRATTFNNDPKFGIDAIYIGTRVNYNFNF